MLKQGILNGGSIAVPLTSCLTGLDLSVLQIRTKIVSCHTADSKPVKQEVNGTVILPPLVFPGFKPLTVTNNCKDTSLLSHPHITNLQYFIVQALRAPGLTLDLKNMGRRKHSSLFIPKEKVL
jgi:hypothetical protein